MKRVVPLESDFSVEKALVLPSVRRCRDFTYSAYLLCNIRKHDFYASTWAAKSML